MSDPADKNKGVGPGTALQLVKTKVANTVNHTFVWVRAHPYFVVMMAVISCLVLSLWLQLPILGNTFTVEHIRTNYNPFNFHERATELGSDTAKLVKETATVENGSFTNLVDGSGSSSSTRIISIGDLHGDLIATKSILRKTGIAEIGDNVQSDGRLKVKWVAGDTTVVSTGDSVDRGEDGKLIYHILEDLAKQAPSHGGQIINLIGNHELMNLQNDLRYVHPVEFDGNNKNQYGGHDQRQRQWAPGGELHTDFLKRYYAAVVVDKTLFVHGGLETVIIYKAIAEDQSSAPLETINNKVRELMQTNPMPTRKPGDKFANMLLGQQGPFWTRLFAERHSSVACVELDKTLELVNATRMVVGHTPQMDGVTTRCAGKMILGDTVISDAYTPVFGFHRPSAVLHEGGNEPKAIYFAEGSDKADDPVAMIAARD